jgi:predicted O-methyltransferase YrrM
MGRILFLDDDHDRHRRFRARMEARDLVAPDRVLYVHSAAEAIAALDAGDIDQAFLDHDLCEADILVPVGAPSEQPTGMAVVDHILTLPRPPASLVVHSYNYEAAVEMCLRLASHAAITVRRIPFSEVLTLLDDGQPIDALSRQLQDNPDDW